MPPTRRMNESGTQIKMRGGSQRGMKKEAKTDKVKTEVKDEPLEDEYEMPKLEQEVKIEPPEEQITLELTPLNGGRILPIKRTISTAGPHGQTLSSQKAVHRAKENGTTVLFVNSYTKKESIVHVKLMYETNCVICNLMFPNALEMSDHIYNDHATDVNAYHFDTFEREMKTAFRCSSCDVGFRTAYLLSDHFCSMQGTGTECDGEFIMTNLQLFEDMSRQYSDDLFNEQIDAIQEDGEGTSSDIDKSEDPLVPAEKARKQVNSENRFWCLTCGLFGTRIRALLTYHRRKCMRWRRSYWGKYARYGPFHFAITCPYCKEELDSLYCLSAHLHFKHTAIMSRGDGKANFFCCSECADRSFPTANMLAQHFIDGITTQSPNKSKLYGEARWCGGHFVFPQYISSKVQDPPQSHQVLTVHLRHLKEGGEASTSSSSECGPSSSSTDSAPTKTFPILRDRVSTIDRPHKSAMSASKSVVPVKMTLKADTNWDFCLLCKQRVLVMDLMKHRAEEHPEIHKRLSVFKCFQCMKDDFPSADAVKEHMPFCPMLFLRRPVQRPPLHNTPFAPGFGESDVEPCYHQYFRGRCNCPICAKPFSTLSTVFRHIELNHRSRLPFFQCRSCKLPFYTPFQLNAHLEPKVCAGSAGVSSFDEAWAFVAGTPEEKRAIVDAEEAKMAKATRKQLVYAREARVRAPTMQQKAAAAPIYDFVKCPICAVSSPSYFYLEDHFNNVHDDVGPLTFACKGCNYTCPTVDKLHFHLVAARKHGEKQCVGQGSFFHRPATANTRGGEKQCTSQGRFGLKLAPVSKFPVTKFRPVSDPNRSLTKPMPIRQEVKEEEIKEEEPFFSSV